MDENTEVPTSSPIEAKTQPASNQDRKNLIETAVRFLKNPKVVPTPLENKRLFLLKKGLTESEVNEALKLADCVEMESKPPSNVEQANQIATSSTSISTDLKPKKHETSRPTSIWSRILKWIRNIILAGCIAFTGYKLTIRFLISKGLIYRPKVKKPLAEGQKLDDSIKEVKTCLLSLKQSVDTMNEMIKDIVVNKQSVGSSSNGDESSSGLRAEIQSIKSLLLNRNQFPSLPTVTPIIPTWQLNSSPNNRNDNKEKYNSNEDEFNAEKIEKIDESNEDDANTQ